MSLVSLAKVIRCNRRSCRVTTFLQIYVLADEFGGVVVKRLEVVSRPGEEDVMVRVLSDNSKHEPAVWNLTEISIIGRYLGRFTAF